MRLPTSTQSIAQIELDGTLTDPREGFVASVSYALRQLGRSVPPESELASHIGPPLEDTLASLLGPKDQARIEAAASLYRERYSAEGIFENRVYPGILEALEELHALGIQLYVGTSKPRVFAERILRHFGLARFFQVVYGSELDGTRSNKRDLIAYVLEQEMMSTKSTYMIGDRAHDMIGAKANAVTPIGVLWGYGSREELRAAGAKVFCEHPSSLATALSFNPALQTTAGSGG